MRDTYTTLQAQAHNYTQTQATDTATHTFLQQELNRAYRYILSELRNFKTQITYTSTTTSGQQYYHNPSANVIIEAITVTIGSVKYNLKPLDSNQKWNDLNAIQFVGLAIPQFFYPRRDDFGIYPKPQGAYVMEMVYSPRYPDMQNEDYTTGTVSITNGTTTITGSATTFTQAMVGRWFKVNTDGSWYRIASYTSATQIDIENNYEGITVSGGAYTIGESPEVPEEVHELLAYRAAEMYFAGLRGDPSSKAQYWGNMFFTGDGNNNSRDLTSVRAGLLGAINRYSSRSDSGIVERNVKKFDDFSSKIWASSIS